MSACRPFSNGAEWDAWSAGWCNQCLKMETCPILDVALIEEQTPTEWRTGDEGALGPERYVCTAYEGRRRRMNLFDPVDAAALRMFNETSAYIRAIEDGRTPDATAMVEATEAYGDAVDASLKGETQDEEISPALQAVARHQLVEALDNAAYWRQFTGGSWNPDAGGKG